MCVQPGFLGVAFLLPGFSSQGSLAVPQQKAEVRSGCEESLWNGWAAG